MPRLAPAPLSRDRSPLKASITRSTRAVPLALAVACLVGGPVRAVTIDWVTVGNVGNAADTNGQGTVNYPFQIGTYEVTIQQWTDFLNVAAKSDPYGLYSPSMATDLNIAGISRSGTSGSYTYSVLSNGGASGNRPITYVSWFDAARFANWMQNGQGAGSTETGAYTLVGGQTSGTAPPRNPGAQFYIPTNDEWYKAAYYSPLLNSGSGGYFTYGTQSNSAPGNVIGGGTNQANYITADSKYSVTQSSLYFSTVNYLSNVGAFTNSASYYGTFDQTGNVAEWNDFSGTTADTTKGIRGGAWNNLASNVTSSTLLTPAPSVEVSRYGFRLAAPAVVPEPSAVTMSLAGLAGGGWSMWRRKSRSRRRSRAIVASLVIALMVAATGTTWAADATWSIATGTAWTTNEAWNTGAYPGIDGPNNASAANLDVATFDSIPSSPIDCDVTFPSVLTKGASS